MHSRMSKIIIFLDLPMHGNIVESKSLADCIITQDLHSVQNT